MHSGVWDEALPALRARFRVHAVDLPGHGHSADADPGRLDEAARRVADELPADTIVCGWSLGGLVAQRMARLFPGKVSAMALVAATPCFVEREDWPHAMKRATVEEFARGLAGDRRGTLERFVRLNALHGKDGREAARTFTARLFARGAPTAAALQATLDWLREADLRADAAATRVPALVIHGARDMIAPVEAGRWLARSIPGARLVEFADCGHLPFFTHRERFVAALESLDG
jgi:pimeloyl-[acyl-carrier protein] methyl ester esterase